MHPSIIEPTGVVELLSWRAIAAMAVARTGLTRLSAPDTDESAIVEYHHPTHSKSPLLICSSIVFVHGLFGDPEKTWTYTPNEPARHIGTLVAPREAGFCTVENMFYKNGLS